MGRLSSSSRCSASRPTTSTSTSRAGKGYSYARAGVQEYLTLDPTGAFVAEARARLAAGGAASIAPGSPMRGGRWQSEQIPCAFGLEGLLATVYTHDGRRMLHEGEIEEELARKDAESERLRRLLDEQRGERE